jgi:hypothetical protein
MQFFFLGHQFFPDNCSLRADVDAQAAATAGDLIYFGLACFLIPA